MTDPDPKAPYGDASPRMAYSRLFFALQRVQRSMMPPIEKALKEAGIADPVWYEILVAAEEAGPAGVQMLVLQRRLFLPQYALSRHVARIEAAGLIRRAPATGAGRGQTLHVTEAGRGLHDRIWPLYRQRIEEALAAHLDPAEAYAALALMNRLYA